MADLAVSTGDGVSADLARISDHAPAMPNFSASKSVAPVGNIAAGGVLHYAIRYENTGVTNTTNVIITDAIPNHTTFLSAQDGGVHIPADDVVSWTVGVVSPGNSKTVRFRVRVNKPLTAGISITNVAYVRSDQTSPIETNVTTNTVAILPDFGLSYKQVTPGGNAVQPGDVVTYTIVYTNGGTDLASDVMIVDCLPAHTTWITGGVYITPCAQFDIGNLDEAMGSSVDLIVRINDDVSGGTIISNFATIDSTQTPPMVTNLVTKTVVAPNLALYKAVVPAGAVLPGDKLTYTLTYTNSGNVDATGVTITDPLPAGLNYLGGGDGWDGDVLSWIITTLPVSTSGQVTFTAWVTDGVVAVHNLAYLNSDQRAPQPSNPVTTPVQTPVLQVYKTVNPSGRVLHGSLLDYTLYYTNTGTIPATGVSIFDSLDDNVEYVPGTGCDYSLSSHSVACPLGAVPAGASDVVNFTVRVSGTLGAVIQNTARVFCDQLYPAAYVSHAPVDVVGSQPYDSVGGNGTFDYFAQSFIATAPLLRQAGIYVYGATVPYPDLRIELWGDTDGNPDSSKAFPTKTMVTDLTDVGKRYFVTPYYPIKLTVGARYWLVINGTVDTGSSGDAGTRYAEGNPYSPGQWVRSSDGGASWTVWNPDTDLDVHVEYVPPPQSNVVTTTTGVEISGPTGGIPGVPYTFMATASLGTITTPLTYTWEATGQSDATRSGGVSDTISHTWGTLGVKTIIVTVTGGENPISGTYQITIGPPKTVYLPVIVRCWMLPGSLVIAGPTTGITGTNYTFDASFKAMRPIDYVWQATEQVSQGGVVTEPNDCSYETIHSTAVFSWTISGTKTITFTATSGVDSISGSYDITVCDRIPESPEINSIENSDIDGDYTVSWSTSSLASEYNLEEATNSTFTSNKKDYTITDTQYLFTARGAEGYYYRVRACDSLGCCSGWSNVEQVKPWYEREPNNSCAQANGPLISNQSYYGYDNDNQQMQKDYYKFYASANGTITIILTDHTGTNGDVQLQLRDQNCEFITYDYSSPYRVERTVTMGWYYILVGKASLWTSHDPQYTLQVTFP